MKTKNLFTITLFIWGALLCFNAHAQISIGGGVPKIGLGKKSKTQTESPSETKTETPTTNDKKYSEAEKSKILDKTQYPDYNKDLEYLNTLAKSSGFSFSGNDFKTDSITYIKSVEAKKNLEAIKLKYNEYWTVYYDENRYHDVLENKFKDINKQVSDFDKNINNYVSYAPTAVPACLEKAKTEYESCKSSGSLKDDFGNDKRKNIYPQFTFAEYYLNILKLVKGDSDASYIEMLNKYKTSKTEIVSGVNILELDLLAKEVAPIDQYKGADKEKHRAEIIKTWNASINPPKCNIGKVVKVYFTEKQWNQKTGIDWDNNGQAYDNSFLNVAIVEQDVENPEKANVYYTYVVKDNKNAGKLDYSYCSCGANKQYSMLVKNVK